MSDCKVCLLPCDPEIHQATLNIRAWLRERLIPKPVQVNTKVGSNPAILPGTK